MSKKTRSVKRRPRTRPISLFAYSPLHFPFTQKCNIEQRICCRNSIHNRPRVYACQTRDVKRIDLSRRQVLVALSGVITSLLVKSTRTRADETDNETSETNNNKMPKGHMTESGLRYFDFKEGEGSTPQWGNLVQFHYTLYTVSKVGGDLVKGDSTYDRGDPYLIHHGNGTTIFGIEEALHSMKVGGRRRIIVPPKLAYVQDGLGPVPPREFKRQDIAKRLSEGGGILVFDLELTKVMEDPNDRGYYQDLTPTPDELLQMFDEIRAKKRAAGLISGDDDS